MLKVISRSAFDLQAVFDTLISSAVELVGGVNGTIFVRDGESFPARAHAGVTPEWMRFLAATPPTPGRKSVTGRVLLSRKTESIADVLADEEYVLPTHALNRSRSLLATPLLRDERIEGVLVVGRSEPGEYTQRQIELVQTFADQAVIAIENVRLFDEVQAKTRDLEESLAQQTATADVLKAISRTAFDLDTVLETLIATAARLCEAKYGEIFRRDGDVYRFAASLKNAIPAYREHEKAAAIRPGRGTLVGRVAEELRAVEIADAWNDPDYAEKDAARLGDVRGMLGVPLMRDGEPIGAFALARAAPVPFTARQIELVATFADQAVIAMENVRLFEEVQAKTRDLEESLAQQTATADVLKVISQSAFDLDAVFPALLATAVQLIGGAHGTLCLRRGDGYRYVAFHGLPDNFVQWLIDNPPTPGSASSAGRVLASGKVVVIPDVPADADFLVPANSMGRFLSILAAPLLREGAVEGVLIITRREAGDFTPRQIELVQTFADQAVIAVENARLFNEVQARTRDLAEALEQQTATADVLKVISRSAFDFNLVTSTILEAAAKLCRAPLATLHLRDGEVCRLVAQFGMSEAFERFAREGSIPALYPLHSRRPLRAGAIAHFSDALNDPEYLYKDAAKLGGYRAIVVIPMMRENELVGIFSLGRAEPDPFTPSQMKLVQTFADQAAIAIENVRLFNEVKTKTDDLTEALQMQTATSDVLKVISRSAFDLQAVFDTLVSSAVELAGAGSGTICIRDGEVFRYRDSKGASVNPALAQYLREHPARPGRATMAGRVLLSGKVERIPDCREDPEYVVPMASLGDSARSLLGVPLLKKDSIEGALVLTRPEPGHFSDRQVEIVQTFADQAVIALENVRLFDEVQARTKELAASLDDLRRAQDRLVQSEKLASLGQLTAGIAHEIKNPLNFVNNFSSLSRELMDELREILGKAPLEGGTRGEADELIGMIDANLDKVVVHGKRADSIVKNMLLHSREGSGERTPVNINAMVEEALNLAYHGARAEKAGFNVTISKSLDPHAGSAEIYAQEMTRVLLNLISNGFYATTKRKQGQSNGAYEPTITASTRDLGHIVEIAIRDNGTGIPDEVKAKMFNPFFTTKPAGEGTGLGLSLSHDIIVKQHGGTIDVSTEPGAFTQFTIRLPRRGPDNAGAAA